MESTAQPRKLMTNWKTKNDRVSLKCHSNLMLKMWTSTQIQHLSGERAMWVNKCMMHGYEFQGNLSKFKENNGQLKYKILNFFGMLFKFRPWDVSEHPRPIFEWRTNNVNEYLSKEWPAADWEQNLWLRTELIFSGSVILQEFSGARRVVLFGHACSVWYLGTFVNVRVKPSSCCDPRLFAASEETAESVVSCHCVCSLRRVEARLLLTTALRLLEAFKSVGMQALVPYAESVDSSRRA